MSVRRKRTGVTLYEPAKACNGYTLVAPLQTQDVWLIDMRGDYVHRWVMPTPPRNHGVLLPNGHLLYATVAPLPPESGMSVPRIGGWGVGAGLIEVDWEGNLLWKYVDRNQNHSFYRMKNGNTMIVRSVRVPSEMAFRVKGGLPGTEDRGMIWADGFHEVTPDGKVIWEWSAADHLDPEVHVMCPLAYRGDWTHMNSCEVLPDGNVLTSFRNIDTICIVDKVTGKIKWQWVGNGISHQHAPTWLRNGNILLFDNGMHRKDGSLICYSRAVELNPRTNKVVWEYKGDPPQGFYSSLISNCQRLPNGNTLICEGMKGRIFEVTIDGEIVWEYINPFHSSRVSVGTRAAWGLSNSVFQAYRYMPDYPGLKGKNLNPGNLVCVNRLYGSETFEK